MVKKVTQQVPISQVTTATTVLMKPTVYTVTQPVQPLQAVHIGKINISARIKLNGYFLVSNPTKTGIMSASVQGSSFSMADILNKDASNSRPSSAAPSGAPASTASSGGSNHVQVRFSIFEKFRLNVGFVKS